MTAERFHLYSYGMEERPSPNPVEAALAHLEHQVEELLRTCAGLREENRSVRARLETLVAERAELIEKTELARNRVEAMIGRLKTMESNP